jgi:hypothetical protein
VSTLLKHIEDDFRQRMTMRRRMFAHLGIELSDTQADAMFEDNRETLLACARCANAESCARWIEGACAGAPMFCKARAPLMRLQVATRLGVERPAARATG